MSEVACFSKYTYSPQAIIDAMNPLRQDAAYIAIHELL